MPVTMVTVPSVGAPPDDPGCTLSGKLFVPDSSVHPPPWPVWVGTQSAGFQSSGNLSGLTTPFTDMAGAGILCLAHFVRTLNGIPNQTTTGEWPQQSNDLHIGIRWARNNLPSFGYSTTRFVGSLGGSGSGCLALTVAIEGTKGDDKSDAAICMSPPTDFSDRQADMHAGDITILAQYANLDPTDLANLFARSPVGLSLSNANPILELNGDHETGGYMPYSMLTILSSAMSEVKGYTAITNTGAAAVHSFAMWGSGPNNGVGPSIIIPWALSTIAQWNIDQSYGTTYSRYMKTFRIVTVDDTGTRTQDIVSYDMIDAVQIAFGNLKTLHRNSIRTVTCTTL